MVGGLLVVASAAIMTTPGAAGIVTAIGIAMVTAIATMTATIDMKGAMTGGKREVTIWKHTIIERQSEMINIVCVTVQELILVLFLYQLLSKGQS